MINDAEKWDKNDREQLKKINAKNSLQSECFRKKNLIKNSKMNVFEKEKVSDKIQKTLDCLKSFQNYTTEDILEMMKSIESLYIY